MTLDRAILIAMAAHTGQVDQQGKPYANHVFAVQRRVAEANPDLGDRALILAILHDLHEDTEVRIIDPPWLVEAMRLVTRGASEPYESYIDRIAQAGGDAGELARAVKLADLEHNLGRLTPELDGLRSRYEKAREYLLSLSLS